MTSISLGRYSSELSKRVIHVERLVVQNLFENCARRRIMLHYVTVDRESAGSCLFRQVKECEHRLIGLIVHLQVIQTVAARREPLALKCRVRTAREGTQKRCRSLTEHHAVTKLVNCMLQVKSAQKRICGNFGSAQDVTSAI